jgi:uncharacterized protein YbjT (DUF2867 family)
MTQKKAILIGASGLVGSHILSQLLNSNYYTAVEVLVRKKIEIKHPKLSQAIVDFDHLKEITILCDDIFCAIGTTINKAGSKAAQYKIDLEIPLELAKMAKNKNAKGFYLVSSIGASANSNNFYLKTKGELEQNLQAIGFDTFVSVRPSILLGDRAESRIGESIGKVMIKLATPFLWGGLKKYAGIEAKTVAKALVSLAISNKRGNQYIESDEIDQIAKAS